MTARPFEIQHLDHLVLRTTGQDALVAFYESLGCHVVRKLEKMGLCQLRAGASMIDIVSIVPAAEKSNSARTERNLDHFAIRIEPFDRAAILAFCEAKGIPAQAMSTPLLGADGYGPAIYIEDPDGNRVELKGPPLADQPSPGKPETD